MVYHMTVSFSDGSLTNRIKMISFWPLKTKQDVLTMGYPGTWHHIAYPSFTTFDSYTTIADVGNLWELGSLYI